MTKRFCITIVLFICLRQATGQNRQTYQDSIATYFDEIKTATKKHQHLWKKNLYAPLLLVNPSTRELYANEPDSEGILKHTGRIYVGQLPNEVNTANTAINWKGKRWAMMLLPLPINKQDRIQLMAHELFHAHQPALGFQLYNVDNNQLDEKEGRIFLRLELEALKMAVQAKGTEEQKRHLTNAITFRKRRHTLYKNADSTENILELNEGLAEYTGLSISQRSKKQMVEQFLKNINDFLHTPTFVRSFAYQTVPIYGYFLNELKQGWNKEINLRTNLTAYFIAKCHISLPKELNTSVQLIMAEYNGTTIVLEETEREQTTKKQLKELIDKFIVKPHLDIAFEQMQLSFNPGNLVPVAEKGTVYPNLRISDKWGILTVENGALLSKNWDKVALTIPIKEEGRKAIGDGWTLELTEGYSITKDVVTGNYTLTKKAETR